MTYTQQQALKKQNDKVASLYNAWQQSFPLGTEKEKNAYDNWLAAVEKLEAMQDKYF